MAASGLYPSGFASALQAFAPLCRHANRGQHGDHKAIADLKRECYDLLAPAVGKLGPTEGSAGDGTISFPEFSAAAERLLLPMLQRTNPGLQSQAFRALW